MISISIYFSSLNSPHLKSRQVSHRLKTSRSTSTEASTRQDWRKATPWLCSIWLRSILSWGRTTKPS